MLNRNDKLKDGQKRDGEIMCLFIPFDRRLGYDVLSPEATNDKKKESFKYHHSEWINQQSA